MIITVRFANLPPAEHRLLSFFREMGPNVKEYWNDVKKEYGGAIKNGDALQKGLGVVGGASSLFFEGTDQLWAGLVDKKVEPPQGPAGRIVRDTKEFLNDVVTLHPLRAASDVFRGISGIPMDAIDLVGGFHQGYNHATRSQVQALMSEQALPL